LSRRRISTTERLALFKCHRGKPLADEERGQHSHITGERLIELENFCLCAIREGISQGELVTYLGASRSRVSRWCVAAVTKSGVHNDRRLIQLHSKTLVQRLFDRMGSPENTCWTWQGSLEDERYGSFAFDGTTTKVHRLVYDTFLGPIPDGFEVDHICTNPACVNPKHLQVVSSSENQTFASVRRRGK